MRITVDFERATGCRFTMPRFCLRYFLNPGLRAVALYRLAHACYGARWFRLANALAAHSVTTTGCEIRPAALVGAGLLLPHPVGIVIGCGAVIGDDCTILQNVTVGERCSRPGDHEYPVIGRGVMISAGAVLLGAIRIGDGALIGANAVVTRDVPPGRVAAGVPARLVGIRCGDLETAEVAR